MERLIFLTDPETPQHRTQPQSYGLRLSRLAVDQGQQQQRGQQRRHLLRPPLHVGAAPDEETEQCRAGTNDQS